jgi:hypothetical protein
MISICKAYDMNRCYLSAQLFFFPVRFGLSDQAYLPWNGTYSKIPHPQRCCFRAYDRLLALASEKWWIFQWEFQDPKLEVPIPYIRPIFEA